MDQNQQPQNQPAPQPAAAQPMPAAVAEDPGKTLAIISIVLAFVGAQIIGLILGILARGKSKKAGFDGQLGLIGIILNAIFTVIAVVVLVVIVLTSYAGIQERAKSIEQRTVQQSQNPVIYN